MRGPESEEQNRSPLKSATDSSGRALAAYLGQYQIFPLYLGVLWQPSGYINV